MDEKNKNILLTIIGCLMMVLIILLIIVALSKVKVEGGCEINNLSFNLNETNNLENLNLSRGKIDCNFKIDVPLWTIVVFGK